MRYEYTCDECNYNWDESTTIAKRDEPTKTPCKKCGAKIRRKICAPGLNFDDTQMKKVGGDWTDVLKKIKKGSGRANRINV
jgi:predicted nucleic acid-binding Zn ribbon protein